MNKTNYTRREFTALAIAGVGGVILKSNAPLKYHYIAFDSFAIFDPSPVAAVINHKYPEKGPPLFEEWRNKQFQYTWLLTSADKFQNFREVLRHSLIYASKKINLSLSRTDIEEFINSYYNLTLWPDTLACLQKLKENNVKMVILSNFTSEMLKQNAKQNNIEHLFEAFISADEVKKFKPSPQIYQLGVKTFKTSLSSILFVPYAPWDAAGAKWYGYPVYWVNRAKSPGEEIVELPNGMGNNLDDLCNWLKK